MKFTQHRKCRLGVDLEFDLLLQSMVRDTRELLKKAHNDVLHLELSKRSTETIPWTRTEGYEFSLWRSPLLPSIWSPAICVNADRGR